MRARCETEPATPSPQLGSDDSGGMRMARTLSEGSPTAESQRLRLETMRMPSMKVRRKSSMLSWQDDGEDGSSALATLQEQSSTDDDPRKQSSELEPLPAQPPPRISLSAQGWLPWLCCQFPGMCLFGILLFQCVAVIYAEGSFLVMTALLTGYVYLWTTNMAIFSAVGAFRMRRDCAKNWHELLGRALAEAPERPGVQNEVMHLVILPNYKEDEDMMKETLENIGQSPSASSRIRIVLGMEAREGPGGVAKAERLMKATRHLFKDICATYHPPGLPGELAGKSSNTQWAYRSALVRYKADLAKLDPTRVFISVGDADTLWNPQYFDALAVQGLTMPAERAAWTIWQPPMLLFRNLYAVPGVTRLAGMGTLLFELAGLANQHIGSHFCFSSYSLTLALASHGSVLGWDPDVVAEDHHMFIKCFFAPLWEAAERSGEATIEPKVELRPIYLPAEGYLVESSEGYMASCRARFQQARRHTQGVAELGYGLLQYVRLMSASGGPARLSIRAHRQIAAILWKMAAVHIVNAAQAFSLVLAGIFAARGFLAGLYAGGIGALVQQGGYQLAAGGFSAFQLAKWALFITFGPAPPVAILSALTIFLVVRDVIEGRYVAGAKHDQDDSGRISAWQKLSLAVGLQRDMLLFAEPTILFYQLIPLILACISLLRQGMRFEYIVAAKPGDVSAH
eukprot:TRINITY_DN2842_c2_g2_i1.p1 TRINITY_DN2842_c2_g2~~TRINITY_DN2842_c2_g2_i1.p1  ORF type:complete len:683 (+),score=161.43 TRINITY_DN2842_c2_g2_i1:93-2141(+)